MRLFKFIALLLFFSSCSLAGKGGAEKFLGINLLDVGQGEAILIECPDQTTQLLIDAGNNNASYPKAEELFLKSLVEELGTDKTLELAINTHSDPDHIEGFRSLLIVEAIKIEKFVHNGVLPGDISLLLEKNKTTSIAIPNSSLTSIKPCGDSSNISLDILRVSKETSKRLNCPFNKNDCSLVMRLNHGNFRMLLAGDTTLHFEEVILKEEELREFFQADILKIGHHASESTSKEFLEAVSPAYTLYSAGKPGVGSVAKWGYPRAQVVDRLVSHFESLSDDNDKSLLWVCKYRANSCIWLPRIISRRILPTTLYGTIKVETDGERVRIRGRKMKDFKYIDFNLNKKGAL